MTDQAAGAEGSQPAVVARGLTKRYHGGTAVGPLELVVPRAGALAILGPPAAGKTTTIRLLAGLARPTAGTAMVGGTEVGGRGWLAARSRLGVLEADPVFYRWMTRREIVAFAAQLVGLPRRERATRVDETLSRVGLASVADRRVDDDSPGLRRRLGLAQAIVGRPEVLLLDEPVASLEPRDRHELLALLRELRSETTVIFSTRTMDDVERLAHRFALLEAGRLILDGPIAELLDRLAQPLYALDFEPGQGSALAALNARLRQESWVAWTALEGSRLRIAIAESSRAARDLLPLVVAAGVRVGSFGHERPTLEDLLAELSGGGRRRHPAA